MNIHSISFLTYIPMFFIFTMYGFDSIVREEVNLFYLNSRQKIRYVIY